MSHGYVHHDLWPDERARIVAEQIAAGKIVGYMAGRMEFGPRALGARSILGDPRREEIQSIMNLKIKHRESFRPFAPSVLEEKASQYFDLKGKSPYMLLIAYVRKDKRYPQNPEALSMGILERLKMKRSDLPAVTHLDYSARIQTVNEQDKPDYYAVISEFEKLTGCPVVVNTSFNVRGEPIVCTYEDACKCFMSTDMDVLVIEDFILYKKDNLHGVIKGNGLMILSSTDNDKTIRKFGVAAFSVFGTFSAIAIWRHKFVLCWFLAFLCILGLAMLLFPRQLRPVFKAWIGISNLIGKTISLTALTLAYFLVITPTA